MYANRYYQLWYVRRAGDLQGPFPALQVRKFAVVGRIREGDELSTDRERWFSLKEGLRHIPVDRMSPAAMADENAQLIAKMREDERSGHDRRNQRVPTQEQLERRSGQERRVDEGEDVLQRRLRKTEFLKNNRSFSERYRTTILASMLVSVVVLSFGYFHLNGNAYRPIECGAIPAASLNFSHCDLAGVIIVNTDLSGTIFRNANLGGSDLHGNNFSSADFSYANLEYSTFKNADLTAATLTGAYLRGGNFDNAQLQKADFSYADLRGASLNTANIDEADFSFALWVDGQVCKANSIGRCR